MCLGQSGDYGHALEHLRRASSIAEEIEHREFRTAVHTVWGRDFCIGLLAPAELGALCLVGGRLAGASMAGIAVCHAGDPSVRSFIGRGGSTAQATITWNGCGARGKLWNRLPPNVPTSTLTDLAWLGFREMDLMSAQRYAEEGLALAREGGDPATVATALQIAAAIWVETGRLEDIRPLLEECLSIWRGLGQNKEQATAHPALARGELKEGNPRLAATPMLEALQLLAPLGEYSAMIEHLVLMVFFEFDLDGKPAPAGQAGTYQPLAYLQHGRLRHGPVQATRVAAAMAAWQDRVIGRNAVQWDEFMAPICEKLEAELGETEFAREFATGRSMSVDDIVAFAQAYARSVLADLQSQPSVEAVRARLSSVAPITAGTTIPAPPIKRGSGGPDALTPREVEVLRLVADGLTNREAAERLVVTLRTINAHLTSIYAKTGVTSRAAAVRFALERGLV